MKVDTQGYGREPTAMVRGVLSCLFVCLFLTSTLSVSGTPGHTLLKAMKNVVALVGLNLESGDKLLLVQPTERCSAVPAAEVTMTVEDGVASAVVDASLEGSYRLCYKFGEIGIQNTAAVVDVVGASVTGQTSEYNAWFSVAN